LVAGIPAANKGLNRRDNDLPCRVGRSLGQKRPELHNQNDPFVFLQPVNKAVFIGLTDNPTHITGSKLSQGNPKRACGLGVEICGSGNDLLQIQRQLLGLGRFDMVDLFLELYQAIVTDMFLDLCQD